MAGIKDLLSLFYWLDNQKEFLLKESVSNEGHKGGTHQSDSDKSPKKSNTRRKHIDRFENGKLK